MDKKKKILTGVASVASVILIYFLYQHFMYVSTDNAQIEAPSVMLAPKVSGFVTKVNTQEGQIVKKGDVLVEIDERDYQNNLKQAQSDLASWEARRRDAESNHNRIAQLYKGNAISQQQFDQATATYNETKAKYEAAAAQVSQAQLNLDNTKIKAPSDGIIARKSVEEGQLAAVGVPLLGFVGSESRWIIANFKETEIGDIKVGSKVYIDVDAISGKDYEGEVEALSSATGATFTLLPPDNATGNFTKVVQRVPVRIKLLNLAPQDIELLKAGLSVYVKVKKH